MCDVVVVSQVALDVSTCFPHWLLTLGLILTEVALLLFVLTQISLTKSEPEFLDFKGAQESIPRN
jgi:hypothetical protein